MRLRLRPGKHSRKFRSDRMAKNWIMRSNRSCIVFRRRGSHIGWFVNGLFDFAAVAAKSFQISLGVGGRRLSRKIAGPGINGKLAVSLGMRLNFDGVITV